VKQPRFDKPAFQPRKAGFLFSHPEEQNHEEANTI
jgi:hypothetical protein